MGKKKLERWIFCKVLKAQQGKIFHVQICTMSTELTGVNIRVGSIFNFCLNKWQAEEWGCRECLQMRLRGRPFSLECFIWECCCSSIGREKTQQFKNQICFLSSIDFPFELLCDLTVLILGSPTLTFPGGGMPHGLGCFQSRA